MTNVRDRVVIVTGGAHGLGLAYVRALLEHGAYVVAADIRGLERPESEAGQMGAADRLLTRHTDVTRPESVSGMTASTLERWGGIDALVNNAALYGGLTKAPLDRISEDEWDRVMAVNVKGLWLCIRSVLPAMRAQGDGSIINISSATILKGTPNFLHYVASKGAVWAMTRSIASEVGDSNIRVNSVTPGLVSNEASKKNYGPEEFERRAALRASDRTLKREMLPTDLIGTVLFLASDASAFITGQNINVDGGGSFY